MMYLLSRAVLAILVSAFSLSVSSQSTAKIPVQQVRGVVTDQVLQTPLPGATVILTGLNRSTVTDERGQFRFSEVPVGVRQLIITNIGYKQVVLDNVNVIAGKETVITIPMENAVQANDTVTIRATTKRNKPLNDMSVVSARAFTVEETQRYAAAVNDPLRMATAFAGVVSPDDGNNNIIIRGNSPMGLLWRMEGIDIPNPNHFSSTGSSGGGISILSAQLLSNSDFVTGAFASEYGNALSGVFDLKLRKGNSEKKEFTLQAGVLGLNAAAEGPIMPFYNGSFLVNYRYSTLELLNKVGIPLAGGSTNFQDLSYNVYLPTKRAGTFTWFGFGGLSSQNEKAEKDSAKWIEKIDRYNSRFMSNTAATGITHSIMIGSRTNLNSAIGFSLSRISEKYDYVNDDYSTIEEYRDNYRTRKWTVTSTLKHRFSPKHTLRTGAIVNLLGFDYYKREKENDDEPVKDVINTVSNTQTLKWFAQWQFRPVNALMINAGLHYLQLAYNKTNSVEPRASIKWQVNKSNSLAFAYGGHSQVQPLGVYFAQTEVNGRIINPNSNLDLTKAHHYVLSYQHGFNKNLSIRIETYYQQLYNVPVSTSDTSTTSMLNVEREYITEALVNEGKGRNYGIEVSLEKYLSSQFYYTITTSLYQSKFTAADGIERDTRFNGNYVSTLVAGKEFDSRHKSRTFGVNIKAVYAGGLRSTPIDLARSIEKGYAVYQETAAFTIQNPAYFRTDLRLSMKWNRRRHTRTLSLDIQNVTNRRNVYGTWFDDEKNKIVTTYQNGLIPVLNYKVEL